MTDTDADAHDKLRAAMTRFAALMHDPCEANLARIAQERVLFSRLFSGHLAEERARLAANAAASGGAAAALLQDYDRRVGALRADYSAHIARWAPAAIAGHWPEYVEAVLALQARLRTLMDWEEASFPVPGRAPVRTARARA
jgi:hypothetical protein